MRIERTATSTRTAKPAAGPKASGFSGYVRQNGNDIAVTDMAPAMMVGGLLQAESDADAAGSRSRGLRLADTLLGDLDGLHRDLILGAVTPAGLRQLADRLDDAETPEDPRLAGLLAEIQLRAAVEIAKFERI